MIKLLTTYFRPLIGGAARCTWVQVAGNNSRLPRSGLMLVLCRKKTVSPPAGTSFRYSKTAITRCAFARLEESTCHVCNASELLYLQPHNQCQSTNDPLHLLTLKPWITQPTSATPNVSYRAYLVSQGVSECSNNWVRGFIHQQIPGILTAIRNQFGGNSVLLIE